MWILDLCEPLKCYRFCCMTALRTADLTLQPLLDELKRDRAKRYRASELNGTKKSPKTYCILVPSLEAGNQLGQGLYLNLVTLLDIYNEVSHLTLSLCAQ